MITEVTMDINSTWVARTGNGVHPTTHLSRIP